MQSKVITEIVEILEKISKVLNAIYEQITNQQEINKLQVEVNEELDKRLSSIEEKINEKVSSN